MLTQARDGIPLGLGLVMKLNFHIATVSQDMRDEGPHLWQFNYNKHQNLKVIPNMASSWPVLQWTFTLVKKAFVYMHAGAKVS